VNRAEFAAFHTLRVRWAEVDRQDVVFNAHYFLYFDVAVTEYWRLLGLEYPDGFVRRYGSDIFAVKATATFHASARYDDVLDVGCRTGRIGRTSIQLLLGIWRGDELLTTGELVYVNTSLEARAPAPWPEPFKAAVLGFERTAPSIAP
jgi:acyl-CoA thioester hydrolase